jgi:hypothetical protein
MDVKLGPHFNGRTQVQDIWKQSAEENMWKYEGSSDRELERIRQ